VSRSRLTLAWKIKYQAAISPTTSVSPRAVALEQLILSLSLPLSPSLSPSLSLSLSPSLLKVLINLERMLMNIQTWQHNTQLHFQCSNTQLHFQCSNTSDSSPKSEDGAAVSRRRRGSSAEIVRSFSFCVYF